MHLGHAASDSAIPRETAVINQKKDYIKAQKELQKEQIGTVEPSEYSGATTLKDNAGETEVLMLGATAINRIARQFGEQLKKDLPPNSTVLLYPYSQLPDFTELETFQSLVTMIEQQQDSDKTQQRVRDKTTGPISPEVVGAALNAANNLLSFFKTDYEFGNVQLNTKKQDMMMLHAISNALFCSNKSERTSDIAVMIPQDYLPADVESIAEVSRDLQKLQEWAQEHTSDDNPVNKLIEQRTNPTENGPGTPMHRIARQLTQQKLLEKEGTFLVGVHVYELSGSYYTKKNIISSIFTTPFKVTGAAVASYAAWNGQDKTIASSMLLPWHEGYHAVSEIQEHVNRSR
ncbi:hypothetical protein CR163_007465 [Prosthecochloris sp. ZM_2]|uniref:hypothetical protein n=1 Tax=Prosthecochloris sp. ZM_2 TaxID=2045206 RepID=UPI000DF80473|nr:hypothetical protein [Prosthecochloris sp. ZM_2]RNA65076.1 hypothetical protein CR163_007465 [Prosthecochloris sp. ZM_2]